MSLPRQITIEEWDHHYTTLRAEGMVEPPYGGPLRRHVEDGDTRLLKLKFDNSAASLNLWNFLLTEEERLREARQNGMKIIGAMKDLGTIPVMAYSLPETVAFYPDGAWWIPCVMELGAGLLDVADSLGIDESFCPVRAMLGAFVTEAHFPKPDLLICSVGAVCDDFSAIAQTLNGLGEPVFWWEIPRRRLPDPDEPAVHLPGGTRAPSSQLEFVKKELTRIREAMEKLTDTQLTDDLLCQGIREANRVRRLLRELRQLAFTSELCPMPALELLVAEMLAIHFCSDRSAAINVLSDLLQETRRRIDAGVGFFEADAVRVFWVNPVADLQAMNLLEACGGRMCGTEYLFSHALDEIPEDAPPMDALASMALADPMIGSSKDRAARIVTDIERFGSECVIISKIPGASHCALEAMVIGDIIRSRLGIPVVEIEVPPLSDSIRPTLKTRLDALMETVKGQRQGC